MLIILSSLFWLAFMAVFVYETMLSRRELTPQTLTNQDRLKFAAAPLGTALMGMFVWGMVLLGFGNLLLIAGLVLLVVGVVISSVLIPKAFVAKELAKLSRWLQVRNLIMSLSCLLFFVAL